MGCKYCYEGTEVLINNFGIKDYDQLQKVERDITLLTLSKMEKRPVAGNFNLQHLQKIHYRIFKDIYPFAGKIREVDISKGSSLFCSAQFIKNASDELFNKLKKERFLKGVNKEQFADRAGYYLGEINAIHPFREGNGRTQREFIRTLALKNGFEIDWERIKSKEMIEGSIKSMYLHHKDLAALIEKAIVNEEPMRELMKAFEKDLER